MTTDHHTPTSSLEEARGIAELDAEWWEAHNHLYRERRIHPSDADHDRATMTRTRLAMNAAVRAAARAEVIREVEALQALVKVLEDGLYRTKARAERHMKGPDAYYGIAMECDKALRVLSQGGEGEAP